MKSHSLLALFILSLSVGGHAEEVGLEIGGAHVTRGMSAESLRQALAAPFRMECDDSTPRDEVVPCMISTPDGSERRLKVFLKDGRVLTAWQPYDVSESTYDAFLSLHQLLLQLTEGKDTCAVIRLDADPARQFTIALPERYIAVSLQEHNRPHALVRVGLRQNPTPDVQLSDCWPGRSVTNMVEAASTAELTVGLANAPPN